MTFVRFYYDNLPSTPEMKEQHFDPIVAPIANSLFLVSIRFEPPPPQFLFHMFYHTTNDSPPLT